MKPRLGDFSIGARLAAPVQEMELAANVDPSKGHFGTLGVVMVPGPVDRTVGATFHG